MRFVFDPGLPHQREAIAAVVDAVATRTGRPLPRPGPGGLPVVGNADADAPALPDRGVEMETGTGKTYVFIRTALELARTAGFRKFVVVVPSVAIREGVLKTLQVTREHFGALYPDVPYRFFVYDRGRLSRLARFVRCSHVDIAVVTIDAFNKASNVLRQPADAFGGAAPLDVLASCRPVLIVDEPHHLESPLRVKALADMRPLLCLRYGATHRRAEGIVHRLTPAQAHAQGLVKTIAVVPCAVSEPLEARFSAQIRACITAHLQRQAIMRPRGVKVLSLFFVDRVSRYLGDDDGLVRRLFDEHWAALASAEPGFVGVPADRVRAAYFAASRSAPVDSSTGRSAADAAAYELIMRDKERLLSLEEPVAFIFSHSALREGWDNPNVFQICTLANSVSAIKKRQEIGRGIRLCVDVKGRRVTDAEVNVLQVFANSSYEDYVAALQSEDSGWEPRDDLPRPARASEGSARAQPGARASEVSWPSSVDAPRLARAVGQLVGTAFAGLEAGASDPARLLDALEVRLGAGHPPCPLSRRTLAEVLAQLPDLDRASSAVAAALPVLVTAIHQALRPMG